MDREKVIERIHEAIDMGVCVDLFMDILELLKEKDTVEHALNVLRANGWEEEKAENHGLHQHWMELPQIVRCKDCKYRFNSMFCPIALIAELLKDTKVFQYKCSNDWFCADGERKKQEAI